MASDHASISTLFGMRDRKTSTSRRTLLKGALAGGFVAVTGCSIHQDSGESHLLDFTSWVFGGRTSDALREALSTYSDVTGRNVNEKSYPFSQYLNQLVLTGRGGRLSGVVHIDEEWMSTLVTAGVISPLDDVVDTKLYTSVTGQTGQYKNNRFGMPWTQSAIGMVTNNELLNEFGINSAEIRDVEDFTNTLRRIKLTDSSIIPYVPCTAVTQLKDFIPWVWSFGGTIIDGEVTLGDRGSSLALDYWKMLLDDDLIQAGVDRDSARTLFAQNRTPIYEDAPQSYGVIPSQSSDPDIASKMGCLPRPSMRGTGQNLIWSQPLVALDPGAETRQALELLSTNNEVLQILFEGIGQPPTTTVSLASNWFQSNSFYKNWNEKITTSSRRNPLWDFPIATSAQRALDECIEQGLSGATTTSKALQDAKEALIELDRQS